MPKSFELTTITFRAGSSPHSAPTVIEPGAVTVLVGPNNSGKTLALRELGAWASGAGSVDAWGGGLVVGDADASWPATVNDALAELGPRVGETDEGPLGWDVANFAMLQTDPSMSGGSTRIRFSRRDPSGNEMRRAVMPLMTVVLDGRSRFTLADTRQMGALHEPATSHWMALEREPNSLEKVDSMVADAFGLHLLVATFRPPNLEPRLSPTPYPPELRHSSSPEAVSLQAEATPLNEYSDGVQVYAGLVSAVSSLPHKLMIIDEPEAFLHPTLATRLGNNLARIATERSGNLVTATHSAEFLLGCVTQVPETTVVRLTYSRGDATARVLTGAEVSALVQNPLLRSAEALRALFADGAVVCEADSDRAFYEEINRRLREAAGRDHAADTIFLNAQNWQTTAVLAEPLRRAGIPAAIVIDLDAVIHDDAWPRLVRLTGASAAEMGRLSSARARLRDLFRTVGRVSGDGSPWRIKRDGLDALNGTDRQTAEKGLSDLAAYGIFAVPVGELEKWLKQFGLTNKQTWVTDMLQALGAPGSDTYVPPGTGDVWTFVESIARWIRDPNRAGIPA